METARNTPGPISFFAHASLAAGWYIAWRLTVFTAPFWAVPAAIAAALLYSAEQPELALVAGLLIVVGLVAAFVASVPITNRVAASWAVKRWGRSLSRGVWWGIFWRVALISLVTTLVTGAFQAGAAMYAAVKPWSPEVLFVTLIPYAVMVASLVVTLRSYGWAMSTMVAKRLTGPRVGQRGPLANRSSHPDTRRLDARRRGAHRETSVPEVRTARDRARSGHRLALQDLRLARAALTITGQQTAPAPLRLVGRP
jgi:hypothetical protein